MLIKHRDLIVHAESGKQQQTASVPLVRYWTWRYVMVLLIMLIVIGLFGMYWIRMNTTEQQFQLLEARSALMTDSFSKLDELLQIKSATLTTPAKSVEKTPQPSDQIPLQPSVSSIPVEFVPTIPDGYQFQIFDQSGNMIYYYSNTYMEKDAYIESPSRQAEVLNGKKIREQFATPSGKFLRVGVPYYTNNQVTGTLYMSAKYNESQLPQMYGLIVLAIGLISLCGWAVVYVLSRSLTRPLMQLALAAKQVSTGNYTPQLPNPERIKEGEIRGLIHSFDEMTGRLGQLEHMRTDMLAGVSHELRTPVTSIRGLLQAIQEGVVTGDKAIEFMHIGLNEAKRLQIMVNDLLDFSSMESGEIHTEKSEISLMPLFEEIAQQLHALSAFSTVKLEYNVYPKDLKWTGDRSHLKQILLNLLCNSGDAAATDIKISVQQDKSFVTIHIADNGKGISLEEVPFIFERYYRGNSRRKKKQGLGLGLPICLLLAQANGGTIELLQTAATGTQFLLKLPVTK